MRPPTRRGTRGRGGPRQSAGAAVPGSQCRGVRGVTPGRARPGLQPEQSGDNCNVRTAATGRGSGAGGAGRVDGSWGISLLQGLDSR